MNKEVNDVGKTSEAKMKANAKYQKKTYDTITFISRREEMLREQICFASEKEGISKTQYIIKSIKTQLAHDGITIDMLPQDTKYTPQLEAKTPKRYLVYMVTEKFLDESDEEFDFIFNPEEYISVFQTLKAAKDYITNKFKRKAHPEQWAYTIYGRSFETKNKRDAYDAYRQMAYDAIKMTENPVDNDRPIPDFIQVMEEKQKPEYVEVIKYEDVDRYGGND